MKEFWLMPMGLIGDLIACYQVLHGAERKRTKHILLPGSADNGRDIDDILFETLQ